MARPKHLNFTEPQWRLLCEVVSGRRTTTDVNYKPRIALEASRLIRQFGFDERTVIATDRGIGLVKEYEPEIS